MWTCWVWSTTCLASQVPGRRGQGNPGRGGKWTQLKEHSSNLFYRLVHTMDMHHRKGTELEAGRVAAAPSQVPPGWTHRLNGHGGWEGGYLWATHKAIVSVTYSASHQLSPICPSFSNRAHSHSSPSRLLTLLPWRAVDTLNRDPHPCACSEAYSAT